MTRLFALTAVALLAAVPAFARADDAKPADAKPADTAATPAATPAATEQGSLSVSSTPAGKVFLDGTDTGLTTPVVDLPVAPGKHSLKIVSADGREQTTDFEMESGGSLNLNLNLPEAAQKVETPKAETPKAETPKAETPKAETPKTEGKPAEAAEAPAPWTWMTVAGWTGLGLGTIGLLSGAVVLTTPTDPDQGPLGFGLFGAGVGLVIGGGVLLYLDTELADAGAVKPGPAPAAEKATEKPAAEKPAADKPATDDKKS